MTKRIFSSFAFLHSSEFVNLWYCLSDIVTDQIVFTSLVVPSGFAISTFSKDFLLIQNDIPILCYSYYILSGCKRKNVSFQCFQVIFFISEKWTRLQLAFVVLLRTTNPLNVLTYFCWLCLTLLTRGFLSFCFRLSSIVFCLSF